MLDVRYFGNGVTALVLGDGAPRQVDDGRGNVTEVATSRVVVLDPTWIEEVEREQLLTERPALHPDTGRPLSETAPGAAGVGRGGPSYDELAAEVARLRAANPGYDPTQDFSGSSHGAAGSSTALTVNAPVGPPSEALTPPQGITLTEAPDPAPVAPAHPVPEGYTDNGDGTYTRQADNVVGAIDWDAKTFHPQA